MSDIILVMHGFSLNIWIYRLHEGPDQLLGLFPISELWFWLKITFVSKYISIVHNLFACLCRKRVNINSY